MVCYVVIAVRLLYNKGERKSLFYGWGALSVRKLRVYLDTSTISHLFAEDAPDKMNFAPTGAKALV